MGFNPNQGRASFLRRLLFPLLGAPLPVAQVEMPTVSAPLDDGTQALRIFVAESNTTSGDFASLAWLFQRSEQLAHSLEKGLLLGAAVEILAFFYIQRPDLAHDIASTIRVSDSLILYSIPILAGYAFVKSGYVLGVYLKSRLAFVFRLRQSEHRDPAAYPQGFPFPYQNVSIGYVLSALLVRFDQSWDVARGVRPPARGYIWPARISYLVIVGFLFLLAGVNNATVFYFTYIIASSWPWQFQIVLVIALLVIATPSFFFHMLSRGFTVPDRAEQRLLGFFPLNRLLRRVRNSFREPRTIEEARLWVLPLIVGEIITAGLCTAGVFVWDPIGSNDVKFSLVGGHQLLSVNQATNFEVQISGPKRIEAFSLDVTYPVASIKVEDVTFLVPLASQCQAASIPDVQSSRMRLAISCPVLTSSSTDAAISGTVVRISVRALGQPGTAVLRIDEIRHRDVDGTIGTSRAVQREFEVE